MIIHVMNFRETLNFKAREFAYAKKTNQIIKFVISNASNNKRASFYKEFFERGYRAARALGIEVPKGYPLSSLDEVFFEKIYDQESFIPSTNDTIIDIGAHTGDWTLYCSKVHKVRKIYAFEPLSENIYWAKKILDLNSCTNVNLLSYGISDIEGKSKVTYVGNQLSIANLDISNGKKEIINFKTLDSLNLEGSILKIDVEGYETKVLQGALKTIRKSRPKIIVETHSIELRRKCNEILETEGYTLKYKGRTVKEKGTSLSYNFDEIVNLFYLPEELNK